MVARSAARRRSSAPAGSPSSRSGPTPRATTRRDPEPRPRAPPRLRRRFHMHLAWSTVVALAAIGAAAGCLGALMLLTAGLMLRTKRDVKRGEGRGPAARPEAQAPAEKIHGWEEQKRLAGAYFDEHAGAVVRYEVVRLWAGMLVGLVAGAISG